MPTLWGAEIGEELMDSVRIQRRLFANPALADAIIRADLDAPGEGDLQPDPSLARVDRQPSAALKVSVSGAPLP